MNTTVVQNLNAAINRLADAAEEIEKDSVNATKLEEAIRLIEEVERAYVHQVPNA